MLNDPKLSDSSGSRRFEERPVFGLVRAGGGSAGSGEARHRSPGVLRFSGRDLLSAMRVPAMAMPCVFIVLTFMSPGPASHAGEAPPYNAAMETGVVFQSENASLQRLHDAAVEKLRSNIVSFTPTMDVLVEGGGYMNAWIETQPMGGEMYAKRNPQVALNNQSVFLLTQRADGRLPGMVIAGGVVRKNGWDKTPPEAHIWLPRHDIMADFEMFQGFCFPEPAWRMYHWMGRDKVYLQKLHDVLAAHDAYLWRTRDSNGDGLLESWCVWDTGEDHGNRLTRRWAPNRWPFDKPPGTKGLPDPENPEDYGSYWSHRLGENESRPTLEQVMVPFESMDVTAYSYHARVILASIAREMGTGKEPHWRALAEEASARLIEKLWDPERHACFDLDRKGRRLHELIHNNLRCMWHGVFTQEMADSFIQHHLLNPREFWTPVPLVSVAVNDPLYESAKGNNWSGQPQGLTWQRAIDALERYGHFAEVSLLGEKLLPVLIRNDCRFSQQLDAMTGEPSGPRPDGYGPMMLAALEYLSRLHGIHLDVSNGRVWWSSVDPAEKDFSYRQRWGDRRFELRHTKGKIEALVGGTTVFTCDAGVRVITDLDGHVLEMAGISPVKREVRLNVSGQTHPATILPNEIHEPVFAGTRVKSRVPFAYPLQLTEP